MLVHDAQIAVYLLRTTFSRIRDALTVIAGLAFAIVLARHSLVSLRPLYQSIVVSAVASVIAPYLYYLLVRRIDFFRSNSVVADVALNASNARWYVVVLAMLVCAAITVGLLVPDASLVAAFLASFCASLLLAVLLSKGFAALRRTMSQQKRDRLEQLLASRHRSAGWPAAAIGGAAIILGATLVLGAPLAASIAIAISIGLVGWFSPISYSTIEYERLVGLTPAYSLRTKLRAGFFVAGALTIGALLSQQWQVPATVAAVSGVLLLYKGLEVLAVRAVGRHKAQIWMVVFLFGLMSIVIALPLVLPVVVVASAWWLVARGRSRIWQLS